MRKKKYFNRKNLIQERDGKMIGNTGVVILGDSYYLPT